MFCGSRHSFCMIGILGCMLIAISANGGKGGREQSPAAKNIWLEGSMSEHDAKLGSTINITCSGHPSPRCGVRWSKDGERVYNTDRLDYVHGMIIPVKKCSASKLIIRNITANDTGNYTCFSVSSWSTHRGSDDPGKSIFVHAVLCFQGYYCPPKGNRVKRCPMGTFSMTKNATSVDQCLPCPAKDKGKIMSKMGLKTNSSFQKNCPDFYLYSSKELSSWSEDENVALGVSVVIVLVIILLVVLCTVRCKRSVNKYKKKLYCPPRGIEFEQPEIPRDNDVFVCYSSKNREWVYDTLLVNLKAQGFRIFIDFIDFEPGVAIQDNIVNGIYRSRKTVFVLSRDSLKSMYARTELRQALVAGKTGHEVIVILYEKCKVPAEVTFMVYLDWTAENDRDQFWEKLFRAIRRPLVNESV